MSMNDIPSGQYVCALVTDEDGVTRFPITVDGQGTMVIELHLWLYAKGSEQPWTSVKKTEVIDPTHPARGGTDTTPYEFMVLSLKNLGADPDKIDDAITEGMASQDGCVVFPGEPRSAIADISYKAGQKGGSFMNVKILPNREVTDDAKSKILEALKARKAANKPQGNPFAPRGQVVSPPPARPGSGPFTAR